MGAGLLPSLDALRKQGQMTWSHHADGWTGEPEEVLRALGSDGFQECKREMTTSRRDCRPVGGLWQGVNPHTKSVASVVWVACSAPQPAMVFLEIDGVTMVSPGREPDADGSRG